MTPVGESAGARTVALLPLAILLLLGNFWGATTAIAKYVAGVGVPPVGYVFWHTGGAGAILLTVALAWRRPPGLAPAHLRYYAICGLTGSGMPLIIMFLVLNHVPAGLMAIVLTLIPLLTYLFALALRMEPFTRLRAGGLALGFTGALLLVVPRGSLPDPAMLPYVLASFVAPVLFAVANVYAARARPAGDSLGLAAGMLLGSAVFVLPLALATGTFHPLWLWATPADPWILLHLSVAATAYFLFFTILRLAGPVYFSQVAYLVTLIGIFWGWVAFDERLSAWVWAALVLIFAGLTLVNLGQRRANRAS